MEIMLYTNAPRLFLGIAQAFSLQWSHLLEHHICLHLFPPGSELKRTMRHLQSLT